MPPHIHRTQDEFIYMLEGKLQVDSEPDTKHAGAGDLIRLPMGTPHGLFNRSGAMVKCLFWVAPQRASGTCSSPSTASPTRPKSCAWPPCTKSTSCRRRVELASSYQPLTKEQPPSLSGRNASSAGVVVTSFSPSQPPLLSEGAFAWNK